jgi:hypothetical protein
MDRARLRTALLTLLVGAAAYVGAFLLVTAEDRRRRSMLEAEHGAELSDAPVPGPQPDGADAAAVDRWRRAADLRRDREEHDRRSRTISMLGYGLLAAFVAQTVLTTALVVRSSRRPAPGSDREPAREPERRAARAPRS